MAIDPGQGINTTHMQISSMYLPFLQIQNMSVKRLSWNWIILPMMTETMTDGVRFNLHRWLKKL